MSQLPPAGRPVLYPAVLRGFSAMAVSTMLARYVPADAWSMNLAGVRPELHDQLWSALAELKLAAEQFRDWRASEFGVVAVDGSAAEGGAAAGPVSVHEISTDEAAVMLGVSPNRVRQLCRGGQLQARQVGKTWLVDAASVRLRGVA